MRGKGFYQDELAAADQAAASSPLFAARRDTRADGRGMAALAHGLPIIAFGPLALLLLGVFILIRKDPRPLVQDATRDAARFDTVAIPAFVVCVVLAVVSNRTDELGFAGGVTVATVFVGAHLVGVLQARRGRRFRYPLPPFLRRP